MTGSPVFSLGHDLVEALAKISPIRATYYGLSGHDDRWDDLSPEGAAARLTLVKDFRRRLASLPPSGDRWSLLGARVLRDWLEEEQSWFDHDEHLLDLNIIDSTFQPLRQVFDLMDTRSADGWENIAVRLSTLDRPCAGYRATLEAGRSSGRVVAKRQVRAVLEQARVNAGESSFFLGLLRSFSADGAASSALAARLESGVSHARRCFGEFAEYLERTYLPAARDVDPVGRDRYLRLARRFLGMEIDPLETYEWGWSQVHEIESAMRDVASLIRPGTSVPEVVDLLTSDPARCAPDVQAFLELMRERQERALQDLSGTHFDIPEPLRRIEVKRAPPGGALGAYYVPPSEDFSRAGTVWYAPPVTVNLALYDEISTAYHEGFPGHHLQCGLQVFLSDRLTRVHRLAVGYSGYAEGWALYAEHLMNELGYLEKPDYVLGMHAAKLMRACRVVVDIGMHLGLPIPKSESFHPGEIWDFDRTVEFMTTRAFLPENHARSEATRYLGWPGQAISYKVGERVILELRAAERGRLGSSFDLKAFHAKVLGSGSVGLSLLRELVDGKV